MTRSIWFVAGAVAFVLHAPLALALLSPRPPAPRVESPASPPAFATVDLRTFRAPVTPPRIPSKRLYTLGQRGHRAAGSGPARTGSARRRALVRLPDRPPETTPSARAVALSEGFAARSDAELAPAGSIVFGRERGGGGSGTGTGPGSGTGVLSVNDVDVAPRRVAGAEPSYPRLDAMAGREGSVTLRFVVHEDGSVSDIVLQEHQGPSSFIEAAREAVARWRFEAATVGGHRVACVCVQRLAFQFGGRR